MSYSESDTDRRLRKWFDNDLTKQLLKGIKLTVGEIRGLSQLDLEFKYPITAIAGRNGAGKSTILAIACCGFHNQRDGFKMPNRKRSYYTFVDFFIQHKEEVPPQGIELYYQIAHNNWRKSEQFPDGSGIGHQIRKKKQGGRWNDYSYRVSRDVVFIGIERIVPHNEKSSSKSYSKSFSYGNIEGWEDKVKDIVGFILDKQYDSFIYATHSRYRLPVVSISDVIYSGFNMGAGENALFEIFSIMHSCSEGSLIVIDEIELGLHIEAQRKFIHELKEVCLLRKLQIICTTHSKDIFDELPGDARIYIERINNKTRVAGSITSDFAFSKLNSSNSNELDILVEDGVAKALLVSVLPQELRIRVNIEAIGSATALSRQLAALFGRSNPKKTLVLFDGDQRSQESNNLSTAIQGLEGDKDAFENWFKGSIQYLPGDTCPEKWIIKKCIKNVEGLSELTATSSDTLAACLQQGLVASKHSEFFTLGGCIGLEEKDILQRCCISVGQRWPDDFSEIIQSIEDKLGVALEC